jgi:hypothetical protein
VIPTGLHVLLQAHERALAEGGELRLVLPGDGPIPCIVTLMCLDQLVPSFASLAEALAQTPATANTGAADGEAERAERGAS